MAKNKITTGEGFVRFEWGDENHRIITVNPNFVYVSLFEDTLSFTLVGVPRPTGLSLFTTRWQDLELDGATFSSAEDALAAIQAAFEAAGASFRWIIVDELPETGQSNIMYLLRIPNPEGGNLFEEYIWVEDAWELVGSNGGSSIRTIYVGTSGDSVNSGTCVINKLEGKKDWLNIVYADSDGYCNMTKINLNEFIIESEFASGITALADGTVVGVCDPRQEKVITDYDLSGNPSTSATVLSVNESGFTVNDIQDAIDAKVLIDRRLYTPKDAKYNQDNQKITFESDLNEDLFEVQLSGDTYLDSGSTNFVQNKVIKEALDGIKKIKAGRGIKIESGVSADTIAFDLPIYSGTDSEHHSLVFNYGGNVASKIDSSAFGRDTKARARFAFAEGLNTFADGEAAHSEGSYTHATGKSSHAEGQYTYANNQSEHASGQFNISSAATSTFGNSGNTLFSVGNGLTGDVKHNSFQIMQDGSIYISDINAEGQYYEKPMVLLQDAIAKGGKPVSGISGVHVESGETIDIISGVVDDLSEKVITDYDLSGNPISSGDVLSVGEDGFKIDNVQDAINAIRHALLIDMQGYTSGATEDLFGILATDTVAQAVKKIEDKLYKDDTTGLIFDESSDETIILSAGEF